MEWGATTNGVTLESCYNVNSFASLAFLPLLFNLFPSHEFNTAPSQCCSLKAYSRSCTGVNWDNCVVWGWATTMLVQLFHGVTGWHRDSMDILQRAECWKCIPEQHRGCNPLRTYKLLDTVCCVLSTTTVIVEFCLIWCGGSLRIAWW